MLNEFLDEQPVTWTLARGTWSSHFFLFYKEIKFICTFLKKYFHIKEFGDTSVCIINHNHNTVHFTKVAHKETSCSLNCERRIFTKTGSLQHYVRLMSNSRAVYTNLREQGILEQCQEQDKCVFWHMLSVSVTGGAWSYFYLCLCVQKGFCCICFHTRWR